MYNLKRIVRPNILKLQSYASARDEFSGDNVTFLDANENPFGELNRYPDPYQNVLKSKLSALESIPIHNIFIGNGSDEIIDLAYRIFCIPGRDKALTFSPTYGMYAVSADINNIDLVQVPLDKDFQINIEALSNYFEDDKLKLIFICSPNNPTGNIFSSNAISYILNEFKGIVIIDEAYVDFSENESWVNKLNDYPNLIVSKTFSKAWGLAAARIGIAYASNDIIQLFNKTKPPYNVSLLNQQAACKALDDIESFETNKNHILKEKILLLDALKQFNQDIEIYPSDANFILIKVNNANKIYDELLSRKVVIRNRNNIIKNCIRITVGKKEENDLLIEAFRNLYQSSSNLDHNRKV